jgi:hypothetical protein
MVDLAPYAAAAEGVEAVADRLLRRAARGLRAPEPHVVEHWRPNSNRKHKVRHFARLSSAGIPILVAKLRTDLADAKVALEARQLVRLAGDGLAAAPIEVFGDEGFVMDYVPDLDLPDVFRRADAAGRLDLARRMAADIAAFHMRSRLSRPPAVDLDSILGAWRPTDGVVAAALELANVGPMHGDLGPWNIRVASADGRLAFIDWEDFRPVGLPALDLLNALLTLTLLSHPAYASMDGETLYRLTLVEPGEMPTLLAEGVRVYAGLTKTDAAVCLALVPVFCRGMLQRFEAEGRPTGHLFYVPLLERFRPQDVQWMTHQTR